MEFVKCYQDLCREIEIYEMRLESLIAQHDAMVDGWLKPIGDVSGIDYSKPRVQENHCKLDMEEELPHIKALEKDIEKYESLIRKVKDCQRMINHRLNMMKGVEHSIAYLRIIENKSLKEISGILGYSYSYIRQIASKHNI